MIDKKLVLAAALAAGSMFAATAANAQAQGQVVSKDPVTGQLRPATAEEAKTLRDVANKAVAGKAAQPRGLLTGRINPQPTVHANGAVEQELDESSQSFSVAVRMPDGSIQTECVTGADTAQAIVKGKKTISKIAKAHGHEHK